MQKDKKFKDGSMRLKGWDYGKNADYFLTIKTKYGEHFFGEIKDEKMCLNEVGLIAEKQWLKIQEKFSYAVLDEFVVMPNHVHGIISIRKTLTSVGMRLIASPHQGSEAIKGGVTGVHNPMFYENISRIIRWYKGSCTYEMRKHNKRFEWQTLFYDSIMWDMYQMENVRNYIKNNPKNWKRI